MTTNKPSTVLGWQIVALLLGVIAALTLVALFSDKSEAAFLTPVIGLAGVGVTQLVAMAKVGEVDRKVDYLANGGMDAKVRAGVADVVKPTLLNDDAAEQITADRATRAAGHKGAQD